MLVVLEGHDGVGKTFLSYKLSSCLQSKGHTTFQYKNPDPSFSHIRDIIDNQNNLQNSFLFYLMASIYNYTQTIIHSDEEIIIIDRYIYSTIVSHSARGYELPKNLLELLPKPDFLFWITTSEVIRKKRILSRDKNQCKKHDLSSLDKDLIRLANGLYESFDMTIIDNSTDSDTAIRQILFHMNL